MEQIHKDALRRTRVALVKDLDLDVICDEVLAHDIFTQLMMEYIMAERTRIDKVRRLLDDLVRRGPNAYRAFLDVLNTTGYDFLANKIQQNEDIVRREKDPNTSFPVQATNERHSAMHPSNITSGFSISNFNNNARNSSLRPVNADEQQNLASRGSSESSVLSSNFSSVSQSSSEPKSKSGGGGLIIHEMESTLSTPSESTDDDTLDLVSGSLNPTSMDVDEDDQIDSVTEENLLRDTGNQHERYSSFQPTDTSQPVYNYDTHFNTRMSFYQQSRSLDKCYIMESSPHRGIVLIINNKDFGKNHTERTGTEHDFKKLKDLFGHLSFIVLERENLTASQMIKELLAFAKNELLRDVDCLVLAVLSHGTNEKIICGVDGRGIDIYEGVFPLFSAKQCPMMRGKPKMFIFNACRGDKIGKSFEIYKPISISSTTTPEKDKLQRDGPSVESSDSQVLDMQDLLMCFSTFPGYTSYRDPNQGSWFIQEFVGVFEEQCDSEHVMDMLTEINRRVSQKKHGENAAETCVQMPFPSSSLTKKWYINPPPTQTGTLDSY